MKKNIVTLFFTVFLTLTCVAFTNAQTDNNSLNKQAIDKKLKILKKPIPRLAECSQSSGLTIVNVTFDKSAKITEAIVIKSSGCDGFDKNSLKAARKIKFEPEIEDGEPITIAKPVEYKFFKY